MNSAGGNVLMIYNIVILLIGMISVLCDLSHRTSRVTSANSVYKCIKVSRRDQCIFSNPTYQTE